MEIEKQITLNPNYILNTEFYNSIKDLVTCSICLNILINPVTCSKCETSYCKNCLATWKPGQSVSNLSCPMKCTKNKFNEPNRVLKNLLEKLEFTCKFGCLEKSVFKYDNILHHLYYDCDYVRVSCSICNSKVKYSDYKKSAYYKTLIKLNNELAKEKESNTKLLQTIDRLNSEIGKLKFELLNLNIDKEKPIDKFESKENNNYSNNNVNNSNINNNIYNTSNSNNVNSNFHNRNNSLNSKSVQISNVNVVSKNSSKEVKKKDVVTIHNNEYDLFDKCPHFKGNYIPIFNCCEKSYPCYICHQEANIHNIEISNKVICLYCKNIYTGNQCDTCGAFQLYKRKFA